jgi:hypothetical protein
MGANTSVGYNSLCNTTTGLSNTAVGLSTLRANTVGQGNVAIGQYSLLQNTTGAAQVAIGTNALRNSNNFASSMNANTAVGYSALCCTSTGLCNVAVGNSSLLSNTGGSGNTTIGGCSLSSNSTGNCNTAVGYKAANNINSGVNSIIAVGACAVTTATTGHTVWGTVANNVCNCVYAAWSNVSDLRDKTNINSLPSKMGLAFIKKLRPVSFNSDHRDLYVAECKYEYGEKDGTLASSKEHYGLIAQELKSTLDELEIRFDGLGHDDEKDAYRLTYEELIAPIIKAIQELNIRLEVVEEKLG